jgi:hypothetical protein
MKMTDVQFIISIPKRTVPCAPLLSKLREATFERNNRKGEDTDLEQYRECISFPHICFRFTTSSAGKFERISSSQNGDRAVRRYLKVTAGRKLQLDEVRST